MSEHKSQELLTRIYYAQIYEESGSHRKPL
jgi:hypothetical protein